MDVTRQQLEKWDHEHVWHPFTPMQAYCQEKPLIIERAHNVEELQGRIAVPILAILPFQEDPFSAPPLALERLDWWKLAHVR